MGLSLRTFLIDELDQLYRLSNVKYSKMLDDSASAPIPRFSGQRVRVADALVELENRRPVGVRHVYYYFLRFDDNGKFDREQWEREGAASVALAVQLETPKRGKERVLVDARDRFIAQGGKWHPSPALDASIAEAAMGRRSCSLA